MVKNNMRMFWGRYLGAIIELKEKRLNLFKVFDTSPHFMHNRESILKMNISIQLICTVDKIRVIETIVQLK